MNCGWWIKIRSVSDKTVNFYIGVPGNSWSTVLKNSTGAVEASTGGSSYGNHSLTATSYGSHTLELTCNWNTTNPCEVCSVDIPSPACTPAWKCELPLNGYEKDGCGNRRLNTACNPPTPPPSCGPNWACELPLNGYEKDGCGNRRLNTACNLPTPSKCTEGTTRTVQCPKDPNKTVIQRCVNGAWVTLPADEKACEKTDQAKIIIAAMIIAIVLIFLGSKAGK